MEKSDLIPYLLLWIAAAVLLLWQSWRQRGSGLILAYCFQLFALYFLGGLIHTLPWSDLPQTEFARLGIQKAAFAMVAFAAGSFVAAKIAARLQSKERAVSEANPSLPRQYIIYGIAFYFVISPTIGRLPGLNAVGAVGAELVVVGLSLNCWLAWSRGGMKPWLAKVAPAFLLPIVTIVVQGFANYGVMALSTVIAFSAQFFRPRWVLLATGVIAGWVGLSGYAAYMQNRSVIRATVWGGAPMAERLDVLGQAFSGAEWFDFRNPDHLAFVDSRLNQVSLVGSAVVNLSNTGGYAHGGTLLDAVIAMIPRLIWPSKPVTAGSGDLVSQFTGQEFASGTSVGVGPLLELYGNFGDAGVWIGFVILGAMIQLIDSMAGWYLSVGNWYSFATWFLVGIAWLNVSGSFVECTAAAAASILVARILNSTLRKSVPGFAATSPAPV